MSRYGLLQSSGSRDSWSARHSDHTGVREETLRWGTRVGKAFPESSVLSVDPSGVHYDSDAFQHAGHIPLCATSSLGSAGDSSCLQYLLLRAAVPQARWLSELGNQSGGRPDQRGDEQAKHVPEADAQRTHHQHARQDQYKHCPTTNKRTQLAFKAHWKHAQ